MAEEEDKTEDATPKKLAETRQKGEVAKSQEVNSVMVIITGLCALFLMGPMMYNQLSRMMINVFNASSNITLTVDSVIAYYKAGFKFLFLLISPVCLSIMVVGVFANIMQFGFLFSLTPIAPKFSKLNPISGIKNLVSMKSIVELFKNLFKLFVVGGLSFFIIRSDFHKTVISLSGTSVGPILKVILIYSFKIGIIIALVFVVMAVFDFWYQQYNHTKKLKMSKQEVKDERKQADGDPKIKARIRAIQQEMAKRKMMSEVPKATVVITNPTYIAIAIQYEMGAMPAPLVLAKGKRIIAEKIREIAKENDIPIVEDKPLARGLYDVVNPGDEIPQEFFTAVAEILAYIYRLKNPEAARETAL